jgi:hypothetical protein
MLKYGFNKYGSRKRGGTATVLSNRCVLGSSELLVAFEAD